MPKSYAAIKIILLGILIFIESFCLTSISSAFIDHTTLFSLDINNSSVVVALMVISCYTYALTLGAWDKYVQYLLIPIPLSLGVLVGTFQYNSVYPLILAVGFLLFSALDVRQSTKLKNLLLKPDPRLIMKFSTRGILFLFSILAGVIFVLKAQGTPETSLVSQISQTIQSGSENVLDGSIGLQQVANAGIIDQLLQPYQSFLSPLMAILTFALFGAYASIAYLIYMSTVGGIYWIAYKTGFMHTEEVPATKTELRL